MVRRAVVLPRLVLSLPRYNTLPKYRLKKVAKKTGKK